MANHMKSKSFNFDSLYCSLSCNLFGFIVLLVLTRTQAIQQSQINQNHQSNFDRRSFSGHFSNFLKIKYLLIRITTKQPERLKWKSFCMKFRRLNSDAPTFILVVRCKTKSEELCYKVAYEIVFENFNGLL